MISNQLALIKRELWEHRSIYVAPISIAVVMILLSMTGQVAISAFGAAVDIAMLSANQLGTAEHRAMVTGFLTGLSSVLIITMWIMTIFYCLDALYAERKDKSILFWRSLPVTDSETVVSKLLVALLLIPAVTFVTIIVMHLASLVFTSIWLKIEGGAPGQMIWSAVDLFDVWAGTLLFVISLPIWLSPFIGWYLLVSAWAKRSPLLIAFMPIFILPMIERIVFGSTLLKEAFFDRTVSLPLFSIEDAGTFGMFEMDDWALDAEAISLLGIMDFGKFLTSFSMWAGVFVCGLFITAAIYVRRFRDES